MRDVSDFKNITLRVNEGLWRRAKSAASLEGRTLSDFIQDLIRAYLEEHPELQAGGRGVVRKRGVKKL